jgi:predicted transcriptional regulator YdeE
MKQPISEKIQWNSLTLVGIQARTSNAAEISGHGKIADLWKRFWEEGILSQIPNRTHPNEFMVAYTEFESDENGPYTILIGAAVQSVGDIKSHLTSIQIPASNYIHVPTNWGPIAEIGLETWKRIWSEEKWKMNRSYIADLEIYGENAKDPNRSQFDIYLGVK